MKRNVFLTCLALLVLMLASTEVPIYLLSFSPWWRLWDLAAVAWAIRGYQVLDKKKPLKEQGIQIIVIAVLFMSFSMLLLPLTLLGFLGIYIYSTFFENPLASDEKEERKKAEKKLKALGADPNAHYICFSQISGVGTLKCMDCGHTIKGMTAFVHGDCSCEIGRQCPNCGKIFPEYNESEKYHTFGESLEDCICPKCHAVVRKKNESIFKGNNDPLFCPKCRSVRLRFRCDYMT